MVFGEQVLERMTVVRDAGGRLLVVLPDECSPEQLSSADQSLRDELGPYARADRLIIDSRTSGAERLLSTDSPYIKIPIDGREIRLIDRRIVGADWVRPPAPSTKGIPRIVFASLKGGVGRSTALCVVAAHLSRRGKRVLAVDLDLEAPGIGTMLLSEAELPPFGSLDYLVENSISGIDPLFLADACGGSFLGSEGARVSVVPAIGKRTVDNPGDALSKIARAYLEDLRPDGPPAPLGEQIAEMLGRFEGTGQYDVILLDARAGLHESTAGAILGLGAEILLFGIDQPQTFLGYRLLFSHLARFPVNPEDDWRDRLHFVQAKASDKAELKKEAEQRFSALYEIVAPAKDSDTAPIQLTAADFDVDWDDDVTDLDLPSDFSPPTIIHVLDDARYRDFDPVSDGSLLSSSTFSATFGELTDLIDLISSDNESSVG
jgi:hypothetical protein